MYRIRKFRAWDPKEERFVSMASNFDFDHSGQLYQISVNGREFIVTESTGLFDIDGKEIFEGDFVKCVKQKKSYTLMTGTYPVTFNKGALCWNNDNSFADIYRWNEVLIKGNIFENLELLKK